MFRRRAEAMLWVENVKHGAALGFFNGSPLIGLASATRSTDVGTLPALGELAEQREATDARDCGGEAVERNPGPAPVDILDPKHGLGATVGTSRGSAQLGLAAIREIAFADRRRCGRSAG